MPSGGPSFGTQIVFPVGTHHGSSDLTNWGDDVRQLIPFGRSIRASKRYIADDLLAQSTHQGPGFNHNKHIVNTS